MKSREPQQVSISYLSHDGCAYSEDHQTAVFGALPGETIIGLPIARRRKKLYLRTTAVENPSPDRVEPVCEAASFCGGCSFQHLRHDAQLGFKQNHLRELLAPLEPLEWLSPVQASPFGYRSKARLGVKYVEKKQRVLVGFREKMKPFIAETSSCPVLRAPVNLLIEPLAELVGGLSIPDQIPQIEYASGDQGSAIVIRHLQALTAEDLRRLGDFGLQHDLQIYLQPGGLDSTHKLTGDSVVEPGMDLLSYQLPDQDLRFFFSPQDFTQVNLEVNRLMVNRALDLLDLSAEDRVLDAFCGIGNFSLAIARTAGEVFGAEQSAGSIQRARDNALENGVQNVDFQVMDLHAESLEMSGFSGVNKVLLDPPRSGAEALVKKVASMDIERVVYVSCNPETLARDVRHLVSAGFDLRAAGIIDMFPHTTHVESIALLVHQERSSRSAK